MLDTKVAAGYLEALAPHVRALKAVRIPGEAASLPAETAAAHATRAGIDATPAGSVLEALQAHIAATKEPGRNLICGSLYLAGHVLGRNACGASIVVGDSAGVGVFLRDRREA